MHLDSVVHVIFISHELWQFETRHLSTRNLQFILFQMQFSGLYGFKGKGVKLVSPDPYSAICHVSKLCAAVLFSLV